MIDSPMLKHLSGYIGGQWCDADNGETFAVLNPANGKELARVPAMGEAETERAIAAARGAVSMDYDLDQRREWLTDIRDALNDEAEEIGRILCLEHGKPWKEAQGEVAYAAGFFDYCAQHLDAGKPRSIAEFQIDDRKAGGSAAGGALSDRAAGQRVEACFGEAQHLERAALADVGVVSRVHGEQGDGRLGALDGQQLVDERAT